MSPAGSTFPTSSSRDAAGAYEEEAQSPEDTLWHFGFQENPKRAVLFHLILVQYRWPKMVNFDFVAEETM